MITFKLVHDNGRQRFYESSAPLTKFPNKDFNLDNELNYLQGRLKDKYKHVLPKVDDVRIVCISDAHTHIERLVFLGATDGIDYFGLSATVHLDGKPTMMIHGGSSRHVHPDSVYLRRIASLNKHTEDTP